MEFLSDGSLGTIALAILLFALVLTFGFEFVNGFHDTANAVATVIYTHSLHAHPGGGLVRPVEFPRRAGLDRRGRLRHRGPAAGRARSSHVGTGAGFAMVFALLLSAIIWNVGTWYLGLPASSSHTLIGSIVGVGLMNSLIARPRVRRGRELGQGRARPCWRC